MIELNDRLKNFVDRTNEVSSFADFIADKKKVTLAVSGPSGRGKTSLRTRLVKYCEDEGLQYAVLTYKDDDIFDYSAILTTCCDLLGQSCFARFLVALNAPVDSFTIQSNISVLDHAEIRGPINTAAGIVMNNPTFNLSPRSAAEMERRRMLTKHFIGDAAARKSESPFILFLDAAEKMTPETTTWLWQTFVCRLGENGVHWIKIVVLGQNPPQPDDDTRPYVVQALLPPLGESDVARYLEIRGLQPGWAPLMMSETHGEPLAVVRKVDAYEEYRASAK